jgi:hypothetical protein
MCLLRIFLWVHTVLLFSPVKADCLHWLLKQNELLLAQTLNVFICIDGIFSLITSRFIDYSNHIYILEFEVKDSNDPSRPYSHSELHNESGSQE